MFVPRCSVSCEYSILSVEADKKVHQEKYTQALDLLGETQPFIPNSKIPQSSRAHELISR